MSLNMAFASPLLFCAMLDSIAILSAVSLSSWSFTFRSSITFTPDPPDRRLADAQPFRYLPGLQPQIQHLEHFRYRVRCAIGPLPRCSLGHLFSPSAAWRLHQ